MNLEMKRGALLDTDMCKIDILEEELTYWMFSDCELPLTFVGMGTHNVYTWMRAKPLSVHVSVALYRVLFMIQSGVLGWKHLCKIWLKFANLATL